jgi:hypothetical protein
VVAIQHAEKTATKTEKFFGLRNLVGLSLPKIIFVLEEKMLIKMRYWSKSTWIKVTSFSIVSSMEQL